MDEPEVEMEVEVEGAEETEKKAEDDDFMFILEEDPEMYAAAGLPIPVSNPGDVQATITHVMNSLPEMSGATENIKVFVVTGNNSTMNF
jgi:hypothetical protein